VADEAILIRFWLDVHVKIEAPSLVSDTPDGFRLVLVVCLENVAPAWASSSAQSYVIKLKGIK
jgi:hypothetical protein